MNILKFPALILIIAFLTVGCTSDPKSDEAEVSEAKEVKQVESAIAYDILTDSSKVTWVGTKPTGRHDGKFPIADGTLNISNGKIVGGEIIIDMANLKVTDEEIAPEDEQKLTGHLKSADFFDVENFPNAAFVITSINKFTEDKEQRSQVADTESGNLEEGNEKSEFMLADPTHTITGNLTMRGNTKSISFPAKIIMNEGIVSAEAKFNINRTDWGVSYGDESKVADKARDKFIYNKVNIGFDIIATE